MRDGVLPREITVTVNIDTEQAVRQFVTAYLRVANWQPERPMPCGCNPERLCDYHAEQRAVDNYHPETIR